MCFCKFSIIFNNFTSYDNYYLMYGPNDNLYVITEFTKNELQLLANVMWLINSLTSALFVLITISQFDIAILRIIYSEITTIFTIRLLLNEKEFINEKNTNKHYV